MGIALGVTNLIIVTSVMNGFRKEFTERIIGFNCHISMSLLLETPNYERIAKQVCSFPYFVKAIPTSEHQELISNTRTVSGSLCHGI